MKFGHRQLGQSFYVHSWVMGVKYRVWIVYNEAQQLSSQDNVHGYYKEKVDRSATVPDCHRTLCISLARL